MQRRALWLCGDAARVTMQWRRQPCRWLRECDALCGGEVGVWNQVERAHALDRDERGNSKGRKNWQPLTGSRENELGRRLRIIDFWRQPRGKVTFREGKTRSGKNEARLLVAGVFSVWQGRFAGSGRVWRCLLCGLRLWLVGLAGRGATFFVPATSRKF